MKCYNCQTELIWGGDHDCEEHEDQSVKHLYWFTGIKEKVKKIGQRDIRNGQMKKKMNQRCGSTSVKWNVVI